jgi:protein-disulfide isomerase
MQSSVLHTKHIIVLGVLVVITSILVFTSIKTYRTTLNLNQDKEQTDDSQDELDIIPISSNDPIQGVRTAPITIIGFQDFLCETCRVQTSYIKELLQKYPTQVKFIWKDLSISTIPASSEMIHIYGYCMNKQQKFEAFKTAIFSEVITSVTQPLLDTLAQSQGADMNVLLACVNSTEPFEHIEKNKQLARALQIQRTPTFFVNGTQIQIPASVFEWEQILMRDI